MANEFMPADVGRDIIGNGGYGTITGYTDGQTVTVTIITPFPSTVVDSGDWTILGTPHATCTPSAADPVGSVITLTLDIAGWRASDVDKFVQINGGLCRITAITSSTVASAVVESELNAAVAAPPLSWTLEAGVWGGNRGYPRCGNIYEQRLYVAGSPAFPLRVWGSVTGEYLDFTLGSLDTDALAFDVSAGEMNPVMHLASVRGLIALTTGGEFSIRGGAEKPITPTNVQVKDQSAYGCSDVPPERIGNELFFGQRAGRKIRAMSSNQYDSEQYNAPDMAVLSEHITRSGVTCMAYQAEPESLLYAVRGDGQLAVLTADRDQDVFGWTRQVTQGRFERVATVPVEDGYRTFVVVSRVINGETTRYIEMLDSSLNTDSALTGFSEVATDTWSGLDHLEGMKVRVKGDGVLLNDRTVEGGQIVIERPANTIEVGLDYVTTIKTLTPEFSVPVGTLQGAKLNQFKVKVRLLETIGCAVNLQEIAFRQLGSEVLDKPPEPFTGDKEVGSLGWGDGQAFTLIQQTLPYDFHLLAVITSLTANDP